MQIFIMNNLKQVGLEMLMHADDREGALPRGDAARWWFEFIPYLTEWGTEKRIFETSRFSSVLAILLPSVRQTDVR